MKTSIDNRDKDICVNVNRDIDTVSDMSIVKELVPALYLIPSTLSNGDPREVLPNRNIEIIKNIRCFVVENLRTARRFLKRCDRDIDIDKLTMVELSEHTPGDEVAGMLDPLLKEHQPIGVISEAGCPAVADPGADLVAIAQRKGLRVVPLVGPSSILLSLMASGFNGQSFAFLGYLPIDAGARASAIKQMQRRIVNEHQTQIFIETPYRNNRLIEELTRTLPPQMRLCVAADITGESETIITDTIARWRQRKYNYTKTPAIFLLFS